MKIQFDREITAQRLSDLFVSAFEGGSNYWAHEANLLSSENKPDPKQNVVWWGHANVFSGAFQIELLYDDPEQEEGNGKGRKVLTEADVAQGLAVMAQEYPRHFGDFINENGDAETADVFLQCVVFGKLIYG